MMLAVLIQANPIASFHVPYGLIMVLAISGALLYQALRWATTLRSLARRRIVVGLIVGLLAGGLGGVFAQLVCGACIGCDPWWLEYFWICV